VLLLANEKGFRRMPNMKKTLTIDIKKLVSVIAICSLVPACGNLSYLDNRSAQEVKANYGHSSDKYAEDYIPREFGTLMLSSSSSDPDDAPTLFFLKRDKSIYYAETMISDNIDDRKSFFKRTYLNFGFDGKSKGMSTKLTMKF
jgi:hypothetical protein